MGTKGSGRSTDSALKNQATASQGLANTAITTAAAPDPFEQRRRDNVNRTLDWEEGKLGPPDVRNFPSQIPLALYRDAKQVTDAGRVGKGYGTLEDGANGSYVAQLDKENELTRGLAASGALEENVNNALTAAHIEAGDLAAAGNSRNMNIAQMRNANANADQDRYLGWLSRPKPPSFLKSLALGVAGGAASNPSIGKLAAFI